jgi:LysR family glycine cleavage system transcriptional activator
MQRLRVATNQIRARAKIGRALDVVRIEAPPSLADCWLLPRLAELVAQHPSIDIRLNAQGPLLQSDWPWPPLADAPADIEIVYGDDKLWSDRASHFLSDTFQPICAPALLEHCAMQSPEELLRHTLLSTARNPVSWDAWLDWQGIDLHRDPVRTLQLDPSHLAIDAALGGMGIILESNILVERHLATGKLVAPFPNLTRPGLSYWLFAPSQRKAGSAVDAVITWLQEQAEAAVNPAA